MPPRAQPNRQDPDSYEPDAEEDSAVPDEPIEEVPALEDGNVDGGHEEDDDGDNIPLTINSDSDNETPASNEAVVGSPPPSQPDVGNAFLERLMVAAEDSANPWNAEEEEKENQDQQFLMTQDTSLAPDMVDGKDDLGTPDYEKFDFESDMEDDEDDEKKIERQIAEDKKVDLNPLDPGTPEDKTPEDKSWAGDGQGGDDESVSGSSSSGSGHKKTNKNEDNFNNLEWLQKQIVELRRRQAAKTLGFEYKYHIFSNSCSSVSMSLQFSLNQTYSNIINSSLN